MPFDLLSLPAELVDTIIDLFNDEDTLQSLAIVCRQTQIPAEAALYRNIFVRAGSKVGNLLRALQARPRRAEEARFIDARFEWGREAGIVDFAPILRMCPNLQEVTIESPYCNQRRWLNAVGWRPITDEILLPFHEASLIAPTRMMPGPLQRLTKMTLHLSGDGTEFWDVSGAYNAVFAHPTLLDLTLSSANIRQETMAGLQSIRTPLKRLTLDECNVSLDGLHGILSLPRALEHIYFGENHYSEEGLVLKTGEKNSALSSRYPQQFMAALSQQRHSLKSLNYWPEGDSPPDQWAALNSIPGLGFADFTQLTSLTIKEPCAFLLSRLQFHDTAPPALTQLCLIYALAIPDFMDTRSLEAMSRYKISIAWLVRLPHALPRLRDLRYTFPRAGNDLRDVSTPVLRGIVECTGQVLLEAKVRSRFYEEAHSGGYVRPILFGEELPADMLIYDAEGGGFLGRLTPAPRDSESDESDWEYESSDDDGSE